MIESKKHIINFDFVYISDQRKYLSYKIQINWIFDVLEFSYEVFCVISDTLVFFMIMIFIEERKSLSLEKNWKMRKWVIWTLIWLKDRKISERVSSVKIDVSLNKKHTYCRHDDHVITDDKDWQYAKWLRKKQYTK